MTTSAQMKRLEALEREARLRRMEVDLDNPPPDVVAMAERFDSGFEVYKQVMREAYQRVEEIGEAAYVAETAAECGCTVEELVSLASSRPGVNGSMPSGRNRTGAAGPL